MPFDKDGWLDYAIKAPGIPDKIYTAPNEGIGIIGHSIVGTYEAALSRFLSTDGYRDADGDWIYSNYAAASVMFIVTYWGETIQMYPNTASTWTSGGYYANTHYWAVELEGGPPGNTTEPMTDLQVMAMMRLAKEWEAHTGKRFNIGEQFREHGEIATQYGYAPTACPSTRYERFKISWVMEQKANDMADNTELVKQIDELRAMVLDSSARLVDLERRQSEATGKVARLEKVMGGEYYHVTFLDTYADRVKALFPAGATHGTVYLFRGEAVLQYADWQGLSILEALRRNSTNANAAYERIAQLEQSHPHKVSVTVE